ncbi:hypothetical protein G9U51_07725 [Calidifontibacter sp. DB0510]|uniref:Uncharacterized protein n=1 Tax=Metallococcus carri TaxID=1656884 RepID=A0A967EEH3_9MICO|nr:hypothetical protein [Metallococcus carri]NHN55666.1 hypothetical protein [Metallococcus carri]NOP38150.1 hypothetical protein [Calidifontibacter sp. DB2511S]
MLLVVEAAQPEVVGRLTDAGVVEASVGPTSPDGWTAAWLEAPGDAVLDIHRPMVQIDELERGPQVTVRDGEGTTWIVGPDDAGHAVTQAAEGLAGMFAIPDRMAEIAALLHEEDADNLVADLAELLPLPELMVEPEPERAVILSRLDRETARMAAAITGPAWLLDLGAGWLATVPSQGRSAEAAAASSVNARRRDHTLVLWRSRQTSGVDVWRRGRIEAGWLWNDPWVHLGVDEPSAESAASGALVAAAASADVHQPSLRALLRMRQPDSDPLPDLIAVLGLPHAAMAVLDGVHGELPDAERVPAMTAPQAWWAAMSRPRQLSGARRVMYAGYAVGTALAALVCVLMTIFSVAVLATGGDFVDQQGTTMSDWMSAGVFAVLSAILIPTARFRFRTLRNRS